MSGMFNLGGWKQSCFNDGKLQLVSFRKKSNSCQSYFRICFYIQSSEYNDFFQTYIVNIATPDVTTVVKEDAKCVNVLLFDFFHKQGNDIEKISYKNIKFSTTDVTFHDEKGHCNQLLNK